METNSASPVFLISWVTLLWSFYLPEPQFLICRMESMPPSRDFLDEDKRRGCYPISRCTLVPSLSSSNALRTEMRPGSTESPLTSHVVMKTARFLWAPEWGLHKYLPPLTGLLWGVNELIHVKHLQQCLTHSKCLINGSGVCYIIRVPWVTVTILQYDHDLIGFLLVPSQGAPGRAQHEMRNVTPNPKVLKLGGSGFRELLEQRWLGVGGSQDG